MLSALVGEREGEKIERRIDYIRVFGEDKYAWPLLKQMIRPLREIEATKFIAWRDQRDISKPMWVT